MVKHKVKVSILGLMEKFMMENGMQLLNMVMEFGKVSMVIAILESGINLELMDMECIHGQMETDMRVNGIFV